MKKLLAAILIFALIAAFPATVRATAATTTATTAAPAKPVVSLSDLLGQRELVEYELKDFGVSVSLPRLEQEASVNSTQSEALAAVGSTADQLLADGYLVYSRDADYKNIFYVRCVSDLASKYTGSFNGLSDEQLADYSEAARAEAADYKLGEVQTVEFRNLDGVRFLHILCKNATPDGDLLTDLFVTVQHGVRYTFLLRVDDPSGSNSGVLDGITASIRLSSPVLGYGLDGAPARNAAGVNAFLLAAVIVLLLAVFALIFLLVRFSAFQRALGSDFNIIGFDLPDALAYERYEDETEVDYIADEGEITIGDSAAVPARTQAPPTTTAAPAKKDAAATAAPVPADKQTPPPTAPAPAKKQTAPPAAPAPAKKQTAPPTAPAPAKKQTPPPATPAPADKQTPPTAAAAPAKKNPAPPAAPNPPAAKKDQPPADADKK